MGPTTFDFHDVDSIEIENCVLTAMAQINDCLKAENSYIEDVMSK